MAVTVDTSTVSYGLGISGQQRKVVRAANGTLVLFGILGTTSTTRLRYCTSTDNGSTWSSWTAVYTANNVRYIDAYIDTSDNILLTIEYYSGTWTIGYLKMTYSSGTWTLGTLYAIASNLYGSGQAADQATITKKSDGSIWVSFFKQTYNTSLKVFTTTTDDGSGTWTDVSTTYTSNISGAALLAVGTDIWAIVQSNAGLSYKIYTSSWGTESTIVASGITNAFISALHVTDSNMLVAVKTASGIKVYKYTGTWDSGTLLSDNANDQDPTLSYIGAVLLCAWRDYDGTNYDIAYKLFNSSWGAQVDITNDSVVEAYPTATITSSGAFYLAYISGSASPYTIYFTSIAISSTIVSTITSDAKISIKSTLTSDAIIKVLGIQSDITSDAKIVAAHVQTTKTSDACIKQLGVTNTKTSDAVIKKTVQNTITSDATIVVKHTSTLNSDASIKATTQSTIISDALIRRVGEKSLITSDAKIVYRNTQNITSDSIIVHRGTSTINSDAVIKAKKQFFTQATISQEAVNKFNGEFTITQAIPVDPTNVQSADRQTGDSIQLTWTDTGNYGYNIYKDVGGSWVLQNATPVIGALYNVGGLVASISYTFKVCGVNGLGTESPGVVVIGTPTFSLAHYSITPIFKVYIDDVEQEDVILDNVELCYGPNISVADWHINVRPDTVGLPEPNRQVVKVKINSTQVFYGRLVARSNKWTPQDISVAYKAQGHLWTYTYKTGTLVQRSQLSIASGLYGYNYLLAKYQCPTGLSNNTIPEKLDARDQTQLDIMSTLCRLAGNYQIYCSPLGEVSYYKFGSPVNVRTMTIGSNILSYENTTDISQKVDGVRVYSGGSVETKEEVIGLGQILKSLVYASTAATEITGDWKDYSGLCKEGDRYVYIKELVIPGVFQDAQGFGMTNEPPEITEVLTYSGTGPEGTTVEVPLNVTPGHINTIAWTEDNLGQWSNVINTAWPSGGNESKPAISAYAESMPDWKGLSVETFVKAKAENSTTVLFKCEVPIVYEKFLIWSTATFQYVTEGTPYDRYADVCIMEEPHQIAGSITLTYTYETKEPYTYASSGSMSGIVLRTLHEDGIKRQHVSTLTRGVNGAQSIDNTGNVVSYTSQKAAEVYSQYSLADVQGSMTVLGDETLDLRTQVNGLEVVRIRHDFSNGFITTLDLTIPQKLRAATAFKEKEMSQLNNSDKSLKKVVYTPVVSYYGKYGSPLSLLNFADKKQEPIKFGSQPYVNKLGGTATYSD